VDSLERNDKRLQIQAVQSANVVTEVDSKKGLQLSLVVSLKYLESIQAPHFLEAMKSTTPFLACRPHCNHPAQDNRVATEATSPMERSTSFMEEIAAHTSWPEEVNGNELDEMERPRDRRREAQHSQLVHLRGRCAICYLLSIPDVLFAANKSNGMRQTVLFCDVMWSLTCLPACSMPRNLLCAESMVMQSPAEAVCDGADELVLVLEDIWAG
jgi:hypothetical protein